MKKHHFVALFLVLVLLFNILPFASAAPKKIKDGSMSGISSKELDKLANDIEYDNLDSCLLWALYDFRDPKGPYLDAYFEIQNDDALSSPVVFLYIAFKQPDLSNLLMDTRRALVRFESAISLYSSYVSGNMDSFGTFFEQYRVRVFLMDESWSLIGAYQKEPGTNVIFSTTVDPDIWAKTLFNKWKIKQ